MKCSRILAVVVCMLALVAGLAVAAEALKSGPQVGEAVPGPFHPLNINGSKAGEKNCLYCSNGSNPVAMIFAREVSAPLANLIERIDAATGKNTDCKMGSFVVFLSDDQALEKDLKKLADQKALKHTVLSIDNPAGPQNYNVSKDADITVVLYKERKVKANHAFKKGELKRADIEKVLGDVTKILPEK